jgi:acyl-CoA synthetase (AMP-forming)/AMP-acid ligase II
VRPARGSEYGQGDEGKDRTVTAPNPHQGGSASAAVDGDGVPFTIGGAVALAAANFGDLEALVGPERRWTFVELHDEVDRIARSLLASGIEHGDRVSIWAPNSPEWVLLSLALARIGAVLVPLNTRFKGVEAGQILGRSGARLLFTVTDFLGTDYVGLLREAGADGLVDEVVVISGSSPGPQASWEEWTARAEDVAPELVAARAAVVRPDDLSHLLFTSGTTGVPKGAMLRHWACTRAYKAWADLVGLRRGDRYLVVNPLFHSFGLMAGVLTSVLNGATIIPQPVLDVDRVMELISSERVTTLPGPPTLFQTILDHPRRDQHDTSSLRLAVTGSAIVPVELIRRMRSELSFATVLTGYGLTESSGMATMCRHDDDPETVSRTAGRAIPGVEVIVVDDNGTAVAPGQPGEVMIRGYNVMAGYWNDPVATAEAITADGWLHSGDIGVLDERGYLHITDRKKDMFIVGGFNAYPAEIEAMIARYEGVGQVAVVGIPDERMGEVGMAWVIPAPGAQVDPDALISWCRTQMANYKVPRRVAIVESFPLSASGKILKYELRRRAALEE